MAGIIETTNLTKKYYLKGKQKTLTALDNVNISIKEGEIFGLLGPNGAGKTTLIKILTTLSSPTSGIASVAGYNVQKQPNKAKSNVALMLESDMLYYRITGYDNLKFFCKIYNISNYKRKINEIISEFGLDKWLYQYVENFSSGMKMKLALCRTILLERKILFLDEPTLGLDVKSISFIIDKLKKLNKTIFLTSHDMNVVEKLCDRVAFINKGVILKVGKTSEIENMKTMNIVISIIIQKDQKNALVSELSKQQFVTNISSTNYNEVLVTLKSREFFSDLISQLTNFKVYNINEKQNSLEELFLNLII
jgi:ABC-2 type transport system ATP-binding protein